MAAMRIVLLASALAGCASAPTSDGTDDPVDTDAREGFVVVTFNTGAGAAEGGEEGGPTAEEARVNQEAYGTGLAWGPAVAAARAWLATAAPDVVAFQEIFWNGECADLEVDPELDLACRGWSEGDPLVVEEVLPEGYQVACNVGKPDKCVAVRRSFGTWVGCEDDVCLDGLCGAEVATCGKGARVARGVIARAMGGDLTVVHVHGSSGISGEDAACRVAQIDRAFVDLGDGEPGVNGEINLVLGDLNTDPARLAAVDASARRWNEVVGEGTDFSWITDVGSETEGSYGGIAGLRLDIDHVASDGLGGACEVAGEREVVDAPYFDHRPVRCLVAPR